MNRSELELDLGTVTMNCTTDEVAATLAALLREMRAVIPRLRADERDTLRQIMSHESNSLTVGDVFPSFERESAGHKTLRRFRAAQFVRPARTGRWDPDEGIEVKPFARLMWDRVGEEVIFEGVPARAADEESVILERPMIEEEAEVAEPAETEPAATEPAAEEVVDLQDVEEIEEQPVVPRKKKSTAFEDVDVLDPGDDDLFAFAQEELRGKG